MFYVFFNGTLEHHFDFLVFGPVLGLLTEVEQFGIGNRVLVKLLSEIVFAWAVLIEGCRAGWGRSVIE